MLIGTGLVLISGCTSRLAEVGRSHAEALPSANPKARLVLVPGYGHDLAYQEVANWPGC